MPIITIIAGIVLDLVGILGWVMSGMESWTALIPSILGTLLLVFGFLSIARPGIRMHLMHGAVVVGLVGFLGTIKGLFLLPTLLGGGDIERPAAVVSQSITALVCFVFVGLCVNSFVQARRAKPPEAK